MIDEQTLKNAISWAVTDVMNYPEDVRARLLGANLSSVTEAVLENVLASGAVKQVNALHGRPLVDRVEVIEPTGRSYVNMDATEVVTSLQDGGKTLKVFIGWEGS